MNNILIYNHDIQRYPPILSAIEALLSINENVVLIAYCSSQTTIEYLRDKGVVYYEPIKNDLRSNKLVKFLRLFEYKRRVKQIVKEMYTPSSILWIYGNQNIWLLHSLIKKYKSILYFFEIPQFRVSLRYRILSPTLDYIKTVQNGWKIVCCEYNRSHITRAYFNLKELPIVIPNKPDFDTSSLRMILDDELEAVFKDKKVILYQGIFNYPERRLDELCQAVQYLPEEYIVCIMGGDDENKARLKKKYESKRVVFLPFIPAPKHLEVTRKAYIGFLSYFSNIGSIETCLNTLYCAPNKIYEYSCFGVPMLSNDVPALSTVFGEYNAGEVVSDFVPMKLAEAVLKIEETYEYYKEGSRALYRSVDIKSIINSLVKSS